MIYGCTVYNKTIIIIVILRVHWKSNFSILQSEQKYIIVVQLLRDKLSATVTSCAKIC